MIVRRNYLEQLEKFKDKDVIKVVTGIRRSGKSTLLQEFANHLKENIPPEQIVFMNLESAAFDLIREYHDLYKAVSQKINGGKKYYVFIDEIQNVENFEKAVNSITADFNVDLYLTGSNAFLLSSELATLLSGRYVEIHLQPLSFAEYYSAQENISKEDAFFNYLKYGSFPFLAKEKDEDVINKYLDGIYNTVVFKDIVKKNSIKDVSAMESILRFTLSSIGSIISPSSISKAMKNQSKKITNETVEKYLEMFCKAYIFEKAVRFDIRGKSYLKSLNKYYVSDLGLRNYVLGYREIEMTHALENAVYNELKNRGYKVDIGKNENCEITFVARKTGTIEYYQVSYSVAQKETLERELRAFNNTGDNYPRCLITMDRDLINDINGIQKIWAPDWFLQGKE
jgi:predicted AAA+ superfamily ATPase